MGRIGLVGKIEVVYFAPEEKKMDYRDFVPVRQYGFRLLVI